MSDARSKTPAYDRDPYLGALAVVVLAAGEDDGRPFLLLDDTVLYPEGGGQPADTGTFGGAFGELRVFDVQRHGDEVRHVVERVVPAGTRGRLAVDWARRFDHMQQHTAQHLLTAVVDRLLGSATTSFHLGAERCDIELQASALSGEQLGEIEEQVAAEVRAARPVRVRRLSEEEYRAFGEATGGERVRSRGLPEGHHGLVRLVEIDGVDRTTCGGTHLRSTAEIELVKLLGAEPRRGGVRLHWVAGGRARRLLGSHERRNAELRRLLETGDLELVAQVEHTLREKGAAERARRASEDELAALWAERFAAAPEPVLVHHFAGRDARFLSAVARPFSQSPHRGVLLLTATSGSGSVFVLAGGARCERGVAALAGRVASALGGRGGGSGRVYQGKAPTAGDAASLAALLKESGQ